MSSHRAIVLAGCLLIAIAARAEDAPPPPAVGDVVYKGLVGKALDAVPMDPDQRVALQRTTAVVNGTVTGRSLSLWAGLAHPLLTVAGLVWGLVSASNIKAAETAGKPATHRVESPEPPAAAEAGQVQVAELTEPRLP